MLGVAMPLWPAWLRQIVFYLALALLAFLLVGRPLVYYSVLVGSWWSYEFEIMPKFVLMLSVFKLRFS